MEKLEVIVVGEEVPDSLVTLLKKNGYDVSVKRDPPESEPVPYRVRITANTLNVRKSPTTASPVVTKVYKGEVYTIVKELGNWGKLKSGVGYLSLNYTERI